MYQYPELPFLSLWERSEVRVRSIATGSIRALAANMIRSLSLAVQTQSRAPAGRRFATTVSVPGAVATGSSDSMADDHPLAIARGTDKKRRQAAALQMLYREPASASITTS